MAIEISNFSGEISTDPKVLDEHATDRSVFTVRPLAVLYPKSVTDISNVLKDAQKNKLSVSVRAGGTCMSGGSLDDGYILNLTKYLNKIEIDPKSKTATVEAGAYFRDIEDAIIPHGLMFAPYPSSHRICGIGGMLGNNASGEQSIRHGATIDNILSLEVILANGEKINTGLKDLSELNQYEKEIFSLYLKKFEKLKKAQGHVTKVASGYRLDRVVQGKKIDLTPLFIGAQGTLGIITKAVLKLAPIPKFHRLTLASVKSLDDLPELLKVARNFNPECIETFDINTFDASKQNLKAETDLVSRYITHKTKLLVLIQFSEETEKATSEQMQKFLEASSHLNIRAREIDDLNTHEALWKLRRTSFTSIQNLNRGSYIAVPCIEDVIVPIENISKLILGLEDILNKDMIAYGFHGHIGDGSLRIIPFFDLSKKNAADRIIGLMKDVFKLVKKCNGNMCADHSDGIIRSPFLKDFYGEELFKVFKEIKNIFDPENVLNPKKKTGGLEEYIKKYIA